MYCEIEIYIVDILVSIDKDGRVYTDNMNTEAWFDIYDPLLNV
jgi:hypothetical protein